MTRRTISQPLLSSAITCTEGLSVIGGFPFQLHNMLNDAETFGFEHVVSWLNDARSFKVHDKEKFESDILFHYFTGQTRYKSFQRQLNIYGFVRRVNGASFHDRGGYTHEFLVRGKPSLCRFMVRTKIKNNHHQQDYNRKRLPPSSSPPRPGPVLHGMDCGSSTGTWASTTTQKSNDCHWCSVEKILPTQQEQSRIVSKNQTRRGAARRHHQQRGDHEQQIVTTTCTVPTTCTSGDNTVVLVEMQHDRGTPGMSTIASTTPPSTNGSWAGRVPCCDFPKVDHPRREDPPLSNARERGSEDEPGVVRSSSSAISHHRHLQGSCDGQTKDLLHNSNTAIPLPNEDPRSVPHCVRGGGGTTIAAAAAAADDNMAFVLCHSSIGGAGTICGTGNNDKHHQAQQGNALYKDHATYLATELTRISPWNEEDDHVLQGLFMSNPSISSLTTNGSYCYPPRQHLVRNHRDDDDEAMIILKSPPPSSTTTTNEEYYYDDDDARKFLSSFIMMLPPLATEDKQEHSQEEQHHHQDILSAGYSNNIMMSIWLQLHHDGHPPREERTGSSSSSFGSLQPAVAAELVKIFDS